jgi:hypothetical protein
MTYCARYLGVSTITIWRFSMRGICSTLDIGHV